MTRDRRLPLLLAAALALFAPVARGQEDSRTRAREAWLARLRTDLTMTDEQLKDVRGVLETLKPGELMGGDSGVSSPAALAERRERSRQAILKIEAVLTPEQRTRWAELREKRRQEHLTPAPAASPAASPSPSPSPVASEPRD